ncbi:hypothetical protein HOG27_05440 [bacterium]|nr:hypothetical protein [bacterium]
MSDAFSIVKLSIVNSHLSIYIEYFVISCVSNHIATVIDFIIEPGS